MFDVLFSLTTTAAWFAICMIVFSVMAILIPLHPRQPLWRRESFLDTLYWFLPAVIYAPLSLSMVGAGLYLMHGGDEQRIAAFVKQGYPPIATQPLWLQFVLLLIVSDFIQYWIHRVFHRSAFWKFHAIHHSPKEVDWMVAARFHPINFLVSSMFVGTLMVLLGFSPVLFAMMVPFNYLYSGLVHANVKWTFGPFKYLLASPIFHHWHHTMSDQGGNKNFAPTLAIYDWLFGTFYMPTDKLPEQYGVDSDDVPENFMGQLFYPFLNADVQASLAASQSLAPISPVVPDSAEISAALPTAHTTEPVTSSELAETGSNDHQPTAVPWGVFPATQDHQPSTGSQI